LIRKTKNNSSPANLLAVVRAGPLMSLIAILREHDIDPGPVLERFGLQLRQFENPDTELPFIATSRFIERCAELTGCEHLGLLVGMRAEPSSLGIAGFMLRTAQDVDMALQALLRHLDLHDQGGVVTLNTNGQFTSLGYALHLSDVSATEQIYDLSITIACNIMRHLCGEDWNPTEVLLSRSKPRDTAPYRQVFRAPIRFNATESAIVFPTRWLKHRTPGKDPLLFEYLEQKAAELRKNKEMELIGQLHRFVRSTLITKCCTAAEAAQYIGVHERTLNRRLRERGTSFRNEVNVVRYAMARSFLANSEATNSEIALALGYTDATTFIHAFKRWANMSPSQWREAHAAG